MPRPAAIPPQADDTGTGARVGPPRRPPPAGQKPGFIAWLARQPKPLVLGGALALIILIAALGPLLSPAPSQNRTGGPAASARVPADTPDRVVPDTLAAAREALQKGRVDEALALADKVLAIDRDNADAIALRTKAQETKQAQPPAANAPPAVPVSGSQPDAGGSTTIARSPGETDKRWQARVRSVETAYANGVSLLEQGSFAAASDAFAAVIRDAPGYRSAEALQARARQGMVEQARQAVDNGMKLEAAGELQEALQEYQRAARLNPAAPQVHELIVQLRSKMIRDAGELYNRAKSYEKLGRIAEAVDLYERAIALLPPDDPRVGDARSRIKALKR